MFRAHTYIWRSKRPAAELCGSIDEEGDLALSDNDDEDLENTQRCMGDKVVWTRFARLSMWSRIGVYLSG
jgi:hypothetical protein